MAGTFAVFRVCAEKLTLEPENGQRGRTVSTKCAELLTGQNVQFVSKIALVPVPEFYRFFRPALEHLQANGEVHVNELSDKLADHFKLSLEDREDLVPSGKRSRVMDRTLWAITYLSQAKLVERPKKGWSRITDRGVKFLSSAPQVIKPATLEQFPEYMDFKTRSRQKDSLASSVKQPKLEVEQTSPEEAIELAHKEVNARLAQELLERIKAMPPAFFEQLIVKLMLRLGYGGSMDDAGKTLGKSGGGGVDGVIK